MSVYPKHKTGELLGLVILSSSVLLTLSLVSYSPLDPSFNVSSPTQQTANYVGWLGAWVSDLLLQFFGLSAFLLPAPLVAVGYKKLRGRRLDYPLVSFVCFLFFVGALCSGLALLGSLPPPEGFDFQPGGVAGVLLSAQLLVYLNAPGSLVVVVTVLLVSLLLSTRFSLEAALNWLGGIDWDVLAGLRGGFQAWRHRRRERKALDRFNREEKTLMTHPLPRRVTFDDKPGLRAAVAEDEGETGAQEEAALASPAQAARVISPPPPAEEAEPVLEVRPRLPRRGPYQLPSLSYLQEPGQEDWVDEEELLERAKLLATKCAEFDVRGRVLQIHPGPVVTTFEFKPDPGVKYSRITSLADDLCLGLKAESVRIDRIPGKNTVGIEVPNPRRQTIFLRQILAAAAYQQSPSALTLALGKLINGNTYVTDLARMPHLLIAGATGAGKSVALNCLVCSILYKAGPEEVRFIMIDPKRLELGVYDGIPHLLTPIVTDPKLAANALGWVVNEMEWRYKLLAQVGVRNITQYNQLVEEGLESLEGREGQEEAERLPYIVVIVDELADLMMTSGKDVETALTRLAQMARAIGIHLILATQRPSVDVLTGLIKANFPCRISFRVSSKIDSRTILDSNGAEQLLGQGDMLFLSPATSRLIRLHGAYITEKEIRLITHFLKEQASPEYHEEILAGSDSEGQGGPDLADLYDDLYEEAARFVVETGKASTSLLQRRLRIGYGRAARLLDMMERDGLVSPPDGTKPREVLVPRNYFDEVK